MPRTFNTEAIVLGSHKLGEADRVINLFTAATGKTPTVVKGVRKVGSRFGGRLEPLSQLQVQLYQGRNLYTLTSATTVKTHASLRENLNSLQAGLSLIELLGKSTNEGEPRPRTFNLLKRSLAVMEEFGRERRERELFTALALGTQLKLLLLAGYLPHLSSCAACGAREGLSSFSAATGGSLCPRCASAAASYGVGHESLEVMRFLLEKPLAATADLQLPPAAANDVWRCLRDLCRYHLGFDLKVRPWL